MVSWLYNEKLDFFDVLFCGALDLWRKQLIIEQKYKHEFLVGVNGVIFAP